MEADRNPSRLRIVKEGAVMKIYTIRERPDLIPDMLESLEAHWPACMPWIKKHMRAVLEEEGPIPDAYGPWFLRLDVPGFRDIGIHGTPFPESIGTRATEGCIRLRNEDILDLKPRIKLGTVVIILPDPA